MIVTLTPNPSVDRTVTLPGELRRGEVHRADAVLSQPGGKGVNISRASVAAGTPTLAVLPADPESSFVHDLTALGVRCATVPPAGPMRVNLTITEPDGTTTKLNTPGAVVTDADLAALADELVTEVVAHEAGWVVLAGSLPPGAPATWYADLVTRLREAGHRVALDTSDAPLEAVVRGLPEPGVDDGRRRAPDLMKPNAEELASFSGLRESELEDSPELTARAAAGLVAQGVGAVLATLGGAGAVLVTEAGAWHAVAPPIDVVSTVGAGDSSLCGYLLAELGGADPSACLASAVAYGTAAAGLPGTTVPTPQDVRPDRVAVRAMLSTIPEGTRP